MVLTHGSLLPSEPPGELSLRSLGPSCILYKMKRYTASELRQNLSRALDEVERGDPVVVDRRGQRFRIVADRPPARLAKAQPIFQVTDLNLLERGWTWSWNARGLSLQVRKPHRGR